VNQTVGIDRVLGIYHFAPKHTCALMIRYRLIWKWVNFLLLCSRSKFIQQKPCKNNQAGSVAVANNEVVDFSVACMLFKGSKTGNLWRLWKADMRWLSWLTRSWRSWCSNVRWLGRWHA